MKEQLFIKNTSIPLSKALNPSINRSITDIREPDKRKSDFSKTVVIPNSKIAAKIFGDIFELNVVDGSFDPTVKADCLYQSDGETIIDGYCKLKSVTRIGEDDIEYNVVLFGSVANIFRGMGEKYLDELADFNIFNSDPAAPDTLNQLSRWNHPWTKDIQEFSWSTQIYDSTVAALIPFELGTGYVYALADYGLTTDLNFFDIKHVPCSIYAKEYIDALFASHGFSYSSTFFDSTLFKSLVIPSDPSSFQLDSTEIDLRQFHAIDPIQLTSTGTTTSANLPKLAFSSPDIIKFTTELSDSGNGYDPTTGEWTTSAGGNYNVSAKVDINATFTPSGSSVVTTSDIEGRLELFVNGVVVNSQAFYITYDDYPSLFTLGARSTNTAPSYPEEQHTTAPSYSVVSNPATANLFPRSNATPNEYFVTFQNIDIPTGAVCSVKWKAVYKGLNGSQVHMFEDSIGNTVPGDAVIDISVGGFFNKLNNTYPAIGQILNIKKLIPKQVKQRDFFKGIINMFNLYVSPDPSNQRNLIIEPREEYYNTNTFNLTDKIDLSQDINIKPIGNLNASQYLYKYKDDVDYYNTKYKENYIKSYGERIVSVNSDFTKKQKKTEVIFSPTPSVAPPQKNKVLPTIIGLDQNNQAVTTKNNIRILFYGGLQPTIDNWKHSESTLVFSINTTYPYMGHFYPTPFNPTEDLNFGLVDEVYYDDVIEPITVTNNNLYNKYHKKFVDEITNRNSKIVEVSVYMTPNDFKQWDFRSQYYFENAYFRLQEIKGYNPSGNDLTKMIFLQIRESTVFVPTYVEIDNDTGVAVGGPKSQVDDQETKPTKATRSSMQPDDNNFVGGKDKSIVGVGNIVAPDSYYIDIQGDGNKVYSGASYINLENSHNNIIDASKSNVTLINTIGLTIEESDVTYINGIKVTDAVGDPLAVKRVTVSQDVEVDVKTYEVDASGGDVTLDFDLATINYLEGQIWHFKKVGKPNNMIITASGGTVDGVANKTIKKDLDSICCQYDGGTNFIIL